MTRSADERVAHGTAAFRVQPGAPRDCLIGRLGEEWKIAVAAQAVEGRANRACIEFLARLLRMPRSAIAIFRGQSSRRKSDPRGRARSGGDRGSPGGSLAGGANGTSAPRPLTCSAESLPLKNHATR